MVLLQFAYGVGQGFDLALHHGHSLCEIVVRPDFTGQFFDLGISDSLLLLQLEVQLPAGLVRGKDVADDGRAACDQGDDDGFV